MLLYLRAIVLWFATADHHHRNNGLFAMKFLEVRRQCLTRSTMRIRKHQQHLPSTHFLQRKLAAPIKARQPEMGRARPGLQPIAFDPALCQRSVAETTSVIISIPVSNPAL